MSDKMKKIVKRYGKDFGLHSEKKLNKYLNSIGYSSLSKLLKLVS